MAHPLEPKAAAKSLKVKVVRFGQSLGHVHAIVAAQVYRGILGDDPLLQGRERNRNLDRRTRLSATREGQLLVDHGQNAAIARVNRHSCAVHIAQGVDRRLPYHWIFSGSHISLSNVRVGKRTGGKVLVGTVAHQDRTVEPPRPAANHHYPGLSHWMGVLQPGHVPARMGALLHMRDMGAVGRVRRTCVGRFREGGGGNTQGQ
jgi:hypothetical protein